METLLPLALFSQYGELLLSFLFLLAAFIGLSGVINLFRSTPFLERPTTFLFGAATFVFVVGFVWIGWFHYQIHQLLPLELPEPFGQMLNRQLAAMNRGAEYGLPLYDSSAPPRW